jgi:hypothetical protein
MNKLHGVDVCMGEFDQFFFYSADIKKRLKWRGDRIVKIGGVFPQEIQRSCLHLLDKVICSSILVLRKTWFSS